MLTAGNTVVRSMSLYSNFLVMLHVVGLLDGHELEYGTFERFLHLAIAFCLNSSGAPVSCLLKKNNRSKQLS